MYKAEHMVASPSQVSCCSGSFSCHKQIMPEEPPECDAACKSTRMSEQKQQLGSEIIPSELDDSECKHGPNQPCSLTENLDPLPEEASKSRFLEKSFCPKPNSKDQQLDFISENTCNQPSVGSENVSPSKGRKTLGSGIVQNDITLVTVDKTLHPCREDVTGNSVTKDMELPHEDASKSILTNDSSCTQHPTSQHELKFPSGVASCEQSEDQTKSGQELLPDESTKNNAAISSSLASGHLEEPKSSPVKLLSLPPDSEINMLRQSESPSKDAAGNSGRLGSRVKRTAKSSRRKYMLRSLISCDRVLRSRSQEKPKAPESSANVVNVSSIEKTRKRKKNKQQKRIEVDEYSRIRAQLRYLLSRICYEQSLITAYSSEGWKGLSLEKIKPEKELQRATSEILRRKSEIRDLFQRIDSLCAEGRFSESLFDSEGQISSEDIFCAKCGSKDLTADNDIILCDGACDRGFHQFCLVPPLLNEDIPPGDEGWLCPGCDCKVDCIDLLNESQGTNVSINDSWKKVFPEAAEDGQNPDQNQGFSSDDSDDNDFDPDRREIDEESEGDESSSDDSDFTSDELEAPPSNKQQVGISSDDSEDDDYNPDAPDHDNNVKEESSSSDFTSDSDDLPFFDSDKFSGEVESSKSFFQGDSISKSSSRGEVKQSLCSELLSTSEPHAGQDRSSSISAKRTVERLDYKKLYDETYGNVSSDTSDDEDYFDAIEPTNSAEAASGSANGNSRRRSISENASGEQADVHEGSVPSSSSGKRVRPYVYKRLGEAVTQRLYQSFKENQYPKRATKESLAKELGLTYQQVTKWFDNTRWSFNHPSPMVARSVRKISDKDSSVRNSNIKPLEPENVTVDQGATFDGAQSEEQPKAGVSPMEEPTKAGISPMESSVVDAKDAQPGSEEITIPQSKTTRRPRKRKHSLDHQPSDLESTMLETEKPRANSSDGKAQEPQTSRRITRRKSIA